MEREKLNIDVLKAVLLTQIDNLIKVKKKLVVPQGKESSVQSIRSNTKAIFSGGSIRSQCHLASVIDANLSLKILYVFFCNLYINYKFIFLFSFNNAIFNHLYLILNSSDLFCTLFYY
jgi:hypothetical protein